MIFLGYFNFILILLITSSALAIDLSNIKDQSVTGSLEEVQAKNVYSHEQYSLAAVQLAKNSIMQYIHGSECQASCPLGCCESSEGLMYEAGLFRMLNHAANLQAAEHRIAAAQACQSFNKLSSQQKNCEIEISSLNSFIPEPNWYDFQGKCLPKAPKECKLMEGLNGNPFQNFNSRIIGDKKIATAFFEDLKLNPDGTLIMKSTTGLKKITISDFSDPKKLINLGLNPTTAQFLTKKFSEIASQRKLTNINNKDIKIDNEPTNNKTINSNLKSSSSNDTQTVFNDSENTMANRNQKSITIQNESDLLINKNGLHLKIGDDPLGLPEQNIFDMIQRRYQSNYESGLFD